MPESQPDPACCPQCGQPNVCGMAAGDPTCWCAQATVDLAAIDRMPADARGKACLCRACATATPDAAAARQT